MINCPEVERNRQKDDDKKISECSTERGVLGSFNHVTSAISIPLTGCWRLNSLQRLQKVWGYLDVSEYLNANYYKIILPRG